MTDEQMDAVSKIYGSYRRLQQAANITVLTHDKGGWFTRLPGFKYDDFNRAGLLSITKLDRLSQTVVANVTDSDFDQLIFFVFGRHWTFSRRLYERAAVEFPMTMRWTLPSVGTSSIDQRHEYFEEEDNNADIVDPTGGGGVGGELRSLGSWSTNPELNPERALATCVFRLVHIDPATRKPTPMAPEIAEIVARCVVVDDAAEPFPIFRRPETIPAVGSTRTFSCRIRVRHDDIDVLQHANVSSYLEFALECAAQAAEFGFYSAISGDVAFYRAKSATSVYMGESRVGDELTVSTWEDDDNKMMLNFAVVKQSKMINYTQIEYYENLDELPTTNAKL